METFRELHDREPFRPCLSCESLSFLLRTIEFFRVQTKRLPDKWAHRQKGQKSRQKGQNNFNQKLNYYNVVSYVHIPLVP